MPGGSQSSAAQAQDPASRQYHGLRCNFSDGKCKQCGHSVKEAWVTSCSHIFCHPHAKQWFSTQKDCPVCRNGPVKIARFDLGATRRERKPVMGMTPPELIQAAESALSFWVNQKVFQLQTAHVQNGKQDERCKKVEETVTSRLKEAEAVCNKAEADGQRLQRTLKAAVEENEKAGREVAGLERQLEDAESQLSGLQKRIAAAKQKEVFRDPLARVPQSQRPSRFGSERLPGFSGDRGPPSRGSGRAAAPIDPAMFGLSSDVGCASFLGAHSRPRSDNMLSKGALPLMGSSSISSDMHMLSSTPGMLGGGRMLKKRKIT